MEKTIHQGRNVRRFREMMAEADKQNIFYTLDNLIKAAKFKAI